MSTNTRYRCAIYTRKSTEEGLEQDFNSLDAQREACEAFIASQAGLGWHLVRKRYDDGGLSGGHMDRPALQQLLEDIRSRKIDVVVVYKVDRLTRSLADFAKIVEVFDAHGVSFVSVTQAFNTTTSMGRLTLNMLLSFAQFEREVTGERIRDKIAASKKKGMWMGGFVPLGYDVVDRKLVVNEAEAATVRKLFELYRRHSNTRLVKKAADRVGLRTKSRMPNNGRREGGVPFTRGHINKILVNRLYIGEITHKGTSYPGEHAPIIDRAVWDAVQAQLARNAVKRRHGGNTKHPSLLAGLLYDGEGRPMTPSHATKAGRRYRYYVSRLPDGAESDTGVAWRLPALALEDAALNGIVSFLGDHRRLSEALDITGQLPDGLKAMLSRASLLADRISQATPADRRRVTLEFVSRIDVRPNRLCITLRAGPLQARLGQATDQTRDHGDHAIPFDVPVQFRRRGVETKVVMTGEASPTSYLDPKLIAAVAQAHHWFTALRSSAVASVRDLAERDRVDRGEVSRILRLAFLAPDIVEAILDGRLPVELTLARLTRIADLPVSWAEQRLALRFL
ncbi:MAG: recombinase family protein [Hyphomicrobiales bacterium]|nr:recombinase family protein [Hyphomicrobiales bacterium]